MSNVVWKALVSNVVRTALVSNAVWKALVSNVVQALNPWCLMLSGKLGV